MSLSIASTSSLAVALSLAAAASTRSYAGAKAGQKVELGDGARQVEAAAALLHDARFAPSHTGSGELRRAP